LLGIADKSAFSFRFLVFGFQLLLFPSVIVVLMPHGRQKWLSENRKPKMQARVLDLDGSIARQTQLLRRTGALILRLQEWGRNLRLACLHTTLTRFEQQLAEFIGSRYDTRPFLTFIGSGDFHHVSLALLRRLTGPFNLLVIDNHPDWMRGIPFLHCGTWLYLAAQLPNVQRIFHLGGAVDFDNAYRWLAPWPMIRSGKIVVAPAKQHFHGRLWDHIAHQPLRRRPDVPAGPSILSEWLAPYRAELTAWPLYISLDKDVLTADEAVVNWDSGHLTEAEVMAVLSAFINAADGSLAGMDVVGDWSPVRLRGWMRRLLHWTEHPPLTIDPNEAARRNQALNLRLLECVSSLLPLTRSVRDGRFGPSRTLRASRHE
jgi:arginase family enzyme